MPAEYIDSIEPALATNSEPTAGLSVYEVEQLLGLMKKVLRTPEPNRIPPSMSFDPKFPVTLAIENDFESTLFYYHGILNCSLKPQLSEGVGSDNDSVRIQFGPEKLYSLEE